jgi:hypothetical protein
VHYDTGWLVEHYQSTVLEHHFEWKPFGFHVLVNGDPSFDPNALTPKDLVTRPQHSSIDLHFTSLDPALQASTRILRQCSCERLIQAQAGQLQGKDQGVGAELTRCLSGRKCWRRIRYNFTCQKGPVALLARSQKARLLLAPF